MPSDDSSRDEGVARQHRAMYPFSFDLLAGAYFFASAAEKEADRKRRRYLNTSCVVFAAATIEAVLNEQISLRVEFGQDTSFKHIPHQFLVALAAIQKTTSLKDKWNLFVSVRGGNLWDSVTEPFQSYETMITVRNELLHYKADFLGHLEPPVNRIRPLLNRLGIPEHRADDTTVVWLHPLLESVELGAWVKEKLKYEELLRMLLAARVPAPTADDESPREAT